jgi:hypothetical protein
MKPGRTASVLFALAAVGACLTTTASGVEGVGIPAKVVDVTKETSTASYPTDDYGTRASTIDDRQGTTTWRIVKDTGNCCENHLDASPDGRLFDIGGSYINYTDDRCLTWKSVQPLEGLVNGEGSMAVAPNGDVVGVSWDAYSGDHLVAYKYDALSAKWFTWENPLHEVFYDRPWLSVVPGPFAIGLGADTVPYISFVQGGTGIKDPLIVSSDGLVYDEPSSTLIDGLNDTPSARWFPITADASFDWIQPIRSSPVTGLGGGYAAFGSSWLLSPEDRKWDAWTSLPDGKSVPGTFQIDSAGRINQIRSVTGGFEYRISADAGRTWTATTVSGALGQIDLHANYSVGIGVVATRVSNQDWLYKFDIRGDTPRLIRRYKVGLGDGSAGAGVGQLTAPRFDFESTAILPDGRVAVSFLDSTTFSHPPGTGTLGRLTPALAIEVDTTLPPLKPDLTVSGIRWSVQKEAATFSADVANVGPGDATGATVRFLVDGRQIGGDRTVTLAPDATATVSSDAWSLKGRKGRHTLQVVADPGGTIAELDETNNTASATFTVDGNRLT